MIRSPAAGGLLASRVAPALSSAGLGVLFAVAVAAGGRLLAFAAATALLLALLVPHRLVAHRFGDTYLAVEAPVALLLLSTLVFRGRDTAALSSDPLDAAALYRVLCVGFALLLAGMALVAPRPRSSDRPASLPLAIRLFGLYVVVVLIGAPLSVYPTLTGYRGLELAAGVLVIAGAFRTAGAEAAIRISAFLYWFILALVASIWAGVFLFPGQALVHGVSPLSLQVQGVYPSVSSNGVGALGVTLALWSLGRLVSPFEDRLKPGLGLTMAAFGFATLAAGQYRTGYVVAAAGLALFLVYRGRKLIASLALAAALGLSVGGFSSLDRQAEPYLLRGQTREQASQLSGRLDFWKHALPVWRRSPIIGRGLVTATRYEVLAPLGFSGVSTIHGTWVEALVGTGIVGVGLLATSLLLLWRLAIKALWGRRGWAVPALLLTAMTVQSVTGTTFEVFSMHTLLLLTIALILQNPPRHVG